MLSVSTTNMVPYMHMSSIFRKGSALALYSIRNNTVTLKLTDAMLCFAFLYKVAKRGASEGRILSNSLHHWY